MDSEPLLNISEDERAASSDVENSQHGFDGTLNGPSLDHLVDFGFNTGEMEDTDDEPFTVISSRDEHSLGTNHRLDEFKEHDTAWENSQDTESTYMTVAERISLPDPSTEHTEDRRTPAYSSRTAGVEASTDSSLTLCLSSWTNEPVTPNTGIAPPLSEGKKYHVFFSYEIADRDWVEETARKLESPELGFKCSIHMRDFHPAKRIIENITEHIRVSEKTVLVLSPDFVQSHWCMFEVELGMVLSMEETQMLLVPVMVRQCDVPDTIKTLTYIDVTSDNDWWKKFLEAITTQDGLFSNFSSTRDLTIQPRYANMDHVTDVSSSIKCVSGEVVRTPYTPDVLLRPGIQISESDFDDAMKIIHLSSQSCFKSVFDVVACFLTSLMVFILAAFLIIPSVVFYDQPNTTRDTRLPGQVAILVILLCCLGVVLLVTFVFQERLRKSRLQREVTEANRKLMKSNVITGFKVDAYPIVLFQIKLSFWYYNITECQRHLATFLRASVRCNSHNDLMDLSQTRATMLINRHSGEYTSAYIAGNLKPKGRTRHVRHASCLCQFIEEKYADGKAIPDFDLHRADP